MLDEQGEKTIVPDPDRAPFIVKLFELYATGNYSLLKLADEAEKIGLRTRKRKKVGKSQVDSILKNPFYCGTMKTKYGLAEHHYKPLISTALYQQAQDVELLDTISEPFILRGMITCAHCGCTVTPEDQITEVTANLKKIHESESLFHTESLTTLRKEQDRIQKRINQMYDDKLDELIDEKMYLDKVKDYKAC